MLGGAQGRSGGKGGLGLQRPGLVLTVGRLLCGTCPEAFLAWDLAGFPFSPGAHSGGSSRHSASHGGWETRLFLRGQPSR